MALVLSKQQGIDFFDNLSSLLSRDGGLSQINVQRMIDLLRDPTHSEIFGGDTENVLSFLERSLSDHGTNDPKNTQIPFPSSDLQGVASLPVVNSGKGDVLPTVSPSTTTIPRDSLFSDTIQNILGGNLTAFTTSSGKTPALPDPDPVTSPVGGGTPDVGTRDSIDLPSRNNVLHHGTQGFIAGMRGQIEEALRQLRPHLLDGTATDNEIDFIQTLFSTKGGAPDWSAEVQRHLGGVLSDFNAEGNSQIASLQLDAVNSGVLPPTPGTQIRNQVAALSGNLGPINQLFQDTLRNELETELEFGDRFAQQQLDHARQFEPQFAELFNQIGIDSLEQFGPELRRLEEELRPDDAQLRNALSNQVLQELNLGGRLTPEQNRDLEQAIRGAQTARGTAFGNSAVAAEAITKGQFAENLKASRKKAAADLLALNSSTSIDPVSALLGRQVTRTSGLPNSTFAGSNFLPFAQQQQNTLGPVPFNTSEADRLSQANALASRRAKDRNQGPSLVGQAGGAIIGGLFGGTPGAAVGSQIGGLFG